MNKYKVFCHVRKNKEELFHENELIILNTIPQKGDALNYMSKDFDKEVHGIVVGVLHYADGIHKKGEFAFEVYLEEATQTEWIKNL